MCTGRFVYRMPNPIPLRGLPLGGEERLRFLFFPEGYVATPKPETACCLPFQNKCSPSQSVPQNSLCTLIYKLNKGSLLVGCTQVRPYVNSNKGTKYSQLLLLSTINPVPLCRLIWRIHYSFLGMTAFGVVFCVRIVS